ncbi:uncharacterized protein LOC129586799 [Paramacrobiotus metropolitanus]|uniref:uncharacterized protein LOC129586799 n=1 Tax=Paramacrobiotus metropolitanus TaxID=2943436 RepID=UPI0024456BF8|nr:uncharacterized protein LOC129586799 [Paramacrobiotus metropolitanus]
MGQLQSKDEKTVADNAGEVEMTDLEKQWMDPHKRKILEAINDVNSKFHERSLFDVSTQISALRRLCFVTYYANDFELIQKCQETFPSLIRYLTDSKTTFQLRLELISAVSILCHGNQVNCRVWAAEGGMKVLIGQLRQIPRGLLTDAMHRQTLQLNVWIVYTFRTVLCGSAEAIKCIIGCADFPQFADMLIEMCSMADVWSKTTERQNYALDCCVLLGIGGKKREVV